MMFRITSAFLAGLAVAIFLNGLLDLFAASQQLHVQSLPRAVVVLGPAAIAFIGMMMTREEYVL